MQKWIFFLSILFTVSCNHNDSPQNFHKILGTTMGTYYIISYYAPSSTVKKHQIDSLLIDINQQLSTYIPSSAIGKFNSSIKGLTNPYKNGKNLEYPMFDKVFLTAKKIQQTTDGYFEPTVMPLVNYWGFGYTEKKKSITVDSQKIKQLLALIGFDKIKRIVEPNGIRYEKSNSKIQLDFSAIAKGYGVDIVGKELEKYGIKNYLIDIGGEILAHGMKPEEKKWTLGIAKPLEDANLTDIVQKKTLFNQAMASSGNYRNFYESNGNKYSHTINPKTGYTERSNLLSTSIIASNCMTADAYATACMVMGLEKSKKMINNIEGLEAAFIINKDGNLAFEYSNGWFIIE